MSIKKYNVEIGLEELSKYLISSRACKLTEGCTLEPKLGRAVWNLSSFGTVKACCLIAKRVSGNGLVALKVNDQEPINIFVSSKISQQLETDSEVITTLEVTRPPNSLGEVQILGLSLQQEEGSNLSNNWKSLIAKCGKYTCLRQVGEKLFASEGATIENGSIVVKLETNPPGFFSRVNDSIKFLGPCEITQLEVGDTAATSVLTSRQLYAHYDAPTPILPSESSASKTDPVLHLVETSVAVFDSQVFRSFDRNKVQHLINKQVKLINSNAKDYLVLKRGGIFVVPMSEIQPNSEYQVEITIQKLNGNGRIHVGFLSEQKVYPTNTEICIAETSPQQTIVNLRSDSGSSFKLHLSMQEDGNGEVLVSRLIVSKKIQQYVPYSAPILSTYNGNQDVTTLEFVKDVAFSIRSDTKHAATLDIQPNSYSYSYPAVKGTIEATNFNGKLWLSRVLSLFPNIKANKLSSVNWKENQSSDVLLTSLDTLKSASRLWLEEYTGKITPEQRQILLQAKQILTPSLPNSLELKTLCGDDKVSLCPLTYPFERVSSQSDSYVLYFEQFPAHTHSLLRVWKPHYPKLLVVGSGCKLPSHVTPISEYQSYRTLLDLICRAQIVIELSNNIHYQSGLLDLCQQLPVKAITNNHYYLLRNNLIVIRSVSAEGYRVPDESSLVRALEELFQTGVSPVTSTVEPEKTILTTMLTLLGKSC
jgi:hypothetical protein